MSIDTTPCDGTPGQPWEDFKRRLRNVATGSDDRGFSLALADHFDDIDEGGAAIGAPAMPANATELRKAQAARRRCQKDSYGLLTKHLLHKEHLQHITRRTSSRTAATHTNNYFDNAAYEESEEQAAGHPKRVCDRAARRETQNVVKPCSVGTESVPMR